MNLITENFSQTIYSENEYFTKKIKESILITTRHGSWEFLDNDEYLQLRKHRLNENAALFRKLENTGIIITQNNVKGLIKKYALQYAFFGFDRMMYAISFNKTCNLNCSYCHAEALPLRGQSENKIDGDIIKNILRFIYSAPFPNIAIQFQGGEPLIQFDAITRFIDSIRAGAPEHKKNIEIIQIVSNLTLMNEDIAKYIIEKDIGLCTSLDGPKELHNSQRKYVDGRGSYDEVTRWIKYFKKNGRHFGFMPTITAESVKCGAKKIIDEYIKWGGTAIKMKPVFGIGRAKGNESAMLPEDYFDFLKEGIEYMVTLNQQGIGVYDVYIQGFLRNIILPYKTYMCARRPCGAALSQLAFTGNGSIFACDFGRSIPSTILGNVEKDDFKDIALKAIHIRTFSQEFQPLCDTCEFNAYCANCFCNNQSNYKDIMPHYPNSFNCQISRLILSYLFEKMQSKEYRRIFTKWAWLKYGEPLVI